MTLVSLLVACGVTGGSVNDGFVISSSTYVKIQYD